MSNKAMKITDLRRCLFFVLYLMAGVASGQDEYGEVYPVEADNSGLVRKYYHNYDSSVVESRSFEAEDLERLREDPEFRYSYTRASMSLWDAFWIWVSYQLRDLFHTDSTSGNWDQLLLFILFAAVLVYVIIRLLKVNTFRILYSDKKGKPIEAIVEEENIHEMDFEKLLKEATEAKNYRLAIRLFYLWSLKMLADANHVHWEPGKTNHDYLKELTASQLNGGFRQLSYYFEYAWYGNFSVSPDLFNRVHGIFSEWKTRI